MVALVQKSGGERLLAVLAVACGLALAGCSETTGTATPTAAATTSSRSDFVDSGQPILLTGGALAANEASAAGSSPTASAQSATTVEAGGPPMPKPAPRMTAAIAEPAPGDIVPPQPQNDGVATLSDTGGAAAAAIAATPAESPAADAPAAGGSISASARAKLVGELQALRTRPGVAPAAGDKCADGSSDPQCAAAE